MFDRFSSVSLFHPLLIRLTPAMQISAPQTPLTQTKPFQATVAMKASLPQQRGGRDLSSPEIIEFFNKVKPGNEAWKALEYDIVKGKAEGTLSPRMKRFAHELTHRNHPFAFEVRKIAYDVLGFPSKALGLVMGGIRGVRINHKHVFNWLPGIQGHINKLHTVNKNLKTGELLAPYKVRVRENMVEVPFHHYQIDKPRSADGRWRLAVFGDPGYKNATLDANTAGYRALMEQQGHKTDAVILLGDVLYAANQRDKHNAFLKSGDMRLLRSNLYEPYKPFIKEKVPLLYTVGNNDSDMGHEDALLAYLNQPRYYQVSLGNDADLFVVDTASWSASAAEKLDHRYNTTRYSTLWEEYATAQQHWLKLVTANSKRDFPERKRILINHFPISSNDDSKKAGFGIPRREYFEELINNRQVYGIDGVINGHEHLASAKSLGVYDTLTSLVTGNNIPEPENSILQFTNGCTSHYEPNDIKNAHLQIPNFARLEANTNRHLKSQPIEALSSNTGFGLLEFAPGKGWYSQVSIPMSNSTYYHGHQLDPGERFDNSPNNQEHPNRFKVHFRLPIVRGSAFSKAAYSGYAVNTPTTTG